MTRLLLSLLCGCGPTFTVAAPDNIPPDAPDVSEGTSSDDGASLDDTGAGDSGRDGEPYDASQVEEHAADASSDAPDAAPLWCCLVTCASSTWRQTIRSRDLCSMPGCSTQLYEGACP